MDVEEGASKSKAATDKMKAKSKAQQGGNYRGY
jgi:hypothetical protein